MMSSVLYCVFKTSYYLFVNIYLFFHFFFHFLPCGTVVVVLINLYKYLNNTYTMNLNRLYLFVNVFLFFNFISCHVVQSF